MNIFITGASGFIGNQLVRRLEGSHALFTPDREFFSNSNDQMLAEFMSEKRVDLVIHLAGYFVPKHTLTDVAPLIDANIILGTRILEALRTRPQAWFINTGSALQNTGPGYDRPFNLYAETKEIFQSILSADSHPHVTLKLFETYGPEDRRDKIFNLIQRSAETGVPLPVSPGEQKLELAFIDDVVDAFKKIIELTVKDPGIIRNKCFAVSGTRVSLRELVAIYEKTTGKKVPALWGSIPYRDNEVMVPWTDFNNVPGFSSQVSLEEGILKTYAS